MSEAQQYEEAMRRFLPHGHIDERVCQMGEELVRSVRDLATGGGDVSAEDEGWGVIRPGDRKAHYYVRSFSLCGRVGFYRGPLEPEGRTSRDDCVGCRRKLAAARKSDRSEEEET